MLTTCVSHLPSCCTALPLPPPPAPACRLIQALLRKAAGTKCGGEQPLPAGQTKLPYFPIESFWCWDGMTFIGAFWWWGANESALETAQGDARNHAALELVTAQCSIPCCQGGLGRNLDKLLLVLFGNGPQEQTNTEKHPFTAAFGV